MTRLLFLFFAFVLFLLSPLRDQIAKSIVVRELSSYLGEPVWIPGLKTTLWPPQVQIQGVQIGSKDQSFVQITQIDIDFQIQSGSPWIHSIDVQSPVLHLPFDEGGLIPFRNRVRGENPIIELPFEDLNVFDAVIVVKKEEITTRVSDLYLEYSNEKGSIRGVIDPIVVGEKTIHISPLSTEFLFVPGRFSLPDISLEVEGVSLRGNILLENGVEGTLSIWGRIPEIARGKKLHLEGELESTIQVSQNNEGLDIHMNGVIHDTELHRLLRSGERDFLPFSELQHKLRFYDGIVFIEELRTPFAGGKVFGKGLYNPILDQLTLGVKLEEVPLWQMGYDLRLSQNSWVSGTVDGTLNLEGSLRDVQFQGPIELMISELDVALGPIDKTSLLLEANDVSIVGLASITRANFSIDDGVLLSGENQAKLDYFVQWGAEPKTDVRLKFSNILLDSLRPFAGMNFVGQGGMDVHLWGKPKALQLTMSSDIYRFSLLGFGRVNRFLSQISSSDLKHWNFSDLKIWNGTTEIGGTLDIDFVDRSLISRLEVSQGRIEDLIPIFFDFTQFEGDASGWISMDGPFLDMKIQSEFLLKDTQIWGEPFSEGYFSMQMRKKFLTVDELSLREGKNELLMRGSMDEEKDLNFEIHSNQWNVSDITTLSNLNLPIDGKIQFHSLLKGKGIRPSGSIEFLDVSYNGIPLQSGNLDFSMETSNGFDLKGELPKAGISYVGNTQSLSIGDNYSINVDLDSFPAHIFYPKSRTGEKIQMETTGDIHIESYGGEFFMEAQLNSFQFRVRNLVLSLLKPTSISFQSNEVSLSGVEIGDGKKTHIQISGGKTFTGDLDYEMFGSVDLSYLPPLIGLVDRSSGMAEIQGSLQGKPNSPIPQFDIQIVDGSFSADWWDHPYEEVQGRLFISPYRYEFKNWEGRMGGGEFLVGGTIVSDYFSVEQLDMNLDFHDGQVQVISYLPPIRGDAKLRLVGTLEEMLLKGDVDISSMLFSKRIDWENAMISIDSTLLEESAKRELEKSWLAFDVDIVAKDTVRIRNNLADVTASANFQMIGDLNRIGTIGSLKAQSGGRILLKERDFEVQRAEIRFLDPYSYDPELDIALFTRVRSIDDEYDINYFVEGLYSKWKFRSHSNPPLQQADINALLFFGMTRSELERMGGLSNTLAVEGTDLLASKIGSVIGFDEVRDGVFQADFLSFDRFDLISGTSSSGAFSSSLRILAEKDLASGSRLRLEKDLTQTEDFYFSFEQKLANTFYLRSFWTSEQRGRFLDIGGAYGLEFQLRLEAD